MDALFSDMKGCFGLKKEFEVIGMDFFDLKNSG
jgi:hypothetical protein